MKRLILILAILATGVAGAMAQQAVAVLTHAGTTKTFDGFTALQDAYAEAASGDLITLSSGTFGSIATIEKAITIRGAGMEYDSIYHTQATILSGNITLNLPETESGHFTLEGIYHNNLFYYSHVQKNPHFIKCRLWDFLCSDYEVLGTRYTSRVIDAYFLQCRVVAAIDCWDDCSISLINCYVGRPYTNSETTSHFYMKNCVVNPYTGYSGYSNAVSGPVYSSTLVNCIISDNHIEWNTNTAFINCLLPPTSDPEKSKNTYQNWTKLQVVFDTFTDTYSDEEDFTMRDEMKVLYCDENGSELGMYGGNFPYTPRLSGPHLKTLNVDSHSTSDGKLRVRLQVESTIE